jgi:predicted nucleic acid-binding Zn ribbon protein
MTNDEQSPEETPEPGAPSGSGPADAPGGEGPADARRAGAARDTTSPAPPTTPDRLCRRCSTVTATAGDFCPHCGASYARRRRLPRPKRRTTLILLAVVALLLVAGAGTGLVLKQQSDDRAERRARAHATAERIERENREREQAAGKQRADAEEDAAAEEVRLQRKLRTITVRELRKAVTKDARDKQADGLLDDRASSTSCENTDGHEDDLDETSAEYSCIAVTDTDDDGSSRGYRFTARVDFEEGSFTWHLGD